MVDRITKAIRHKVKREQRGYVYILVLIFLVIGALMIPPLLNFMSTGLGSGRIFEQKAEELYACDAGIDDAIWQIKYENVSTLSDPVAYDEYGYYEYDPDYEWSYDLTEGINDETVTVTIKNVWVPQNIAAPSPDDARDVIEGTDEYGCRIRVNGSATANSEYRIRIDILPQEEWDLVVHSIGIWLPSGFHYDTTKESNLEYWGLSDPPSVEPYAGGEAVIWDLGSTEFSTLPGTQETAIVEFDYTSETVRDLVTVSWIDADNLGVGLPIPYYSWDDDTKVFALTSASSSGTTVESNIYMNARYSSLLENAITSPHDIILKPNTEVNGDVQYNGSLEQGSGSTINGDIIEDPIDWPSIEEWRAFFLRDPDLDGADDPSPSADIDDYYDAGSIGPWNCSGGLNISNSRLGCVEPVKLNGTIYVNGPLDVAGPHDYLLDLHYETIFVDGDIDMSSQKVWLTGSGCIIATGDVIFKPNLDTEVGFIFVCSLGGTVDFQPNGNFYGSVAGDVKCELGSGTGGTITHTPPPGMLNLPGMGGGSTGGFGSNITKYNWKIE